jgi:hypothetical protein
MRILVFVTDDGNSPEGTGPVLYLRDSPEASLPPHPRSLEWRYFATMDSEDELVADRRPELLARLAQRQPYLCPELIVGRRAASFQWEPQEEQS